MNKELKKINYESFITQYTDEIINDIRKCLKNHHFDTIAIDTLDICHLIGKIDNLQEEIARLKRRNKKLKEQYKKEEKKLFHDNEILQTRIDKAKDYLETCMINPEDLSLYENITKEECLKLLDILRGEE